MYVKESPRESARGRRRPWGLAEPEVESTRVDGVGQEV